VFPGLTCRSSSNNLHKNSASVSNRAEGARADPSSSCLRHRLARAAAAAPLAAAAHAAAAVARAAAAPREIR